MVMCYEEKQSRVKRGQIDGRGYSVLQTECSCSPTIHAETLIPGVMVFGGGAFGK